MHIKRFLIALVLSPFIVYPLTASFHEYIVSPHALQPEAKEQASLPYSAGVINPPQQSNLEKITEKLKKFKDKNYRNSNSKRYANLKKCEKRLLNNLSPFKQFCKRYAPTRAIMEEIQHSFQQLGYKQLGGYINRHLTSVYYKGSDINRLINAERLGACIQKYNLDRLAVPRKYIYKLCDRHHVFAERITKGSRDLLLQDIQQLFTIVEKTGYADWCSQNIMVDKATGMLVFIDTEDRSFVDDIKAQKQIAIDNLFDFIKERKFEKNQEIFALNQLKNRDEINIRPFNTQNDQSIPFNTSLDTQGIDFEKVKKEYAIFNTKNP